MRVVLKIIQGPDRGREFVYDTPNVLIVGRGEEAHIRLSRDDQYISRRHMVLEISPPRCIATNLSKTNTTCVNSESIQEQELQNGDVIEIGYTQILVVIKDELISHKTKCPKCGIILELLEGEDPETACPVCKLDTQAIKQIVRQLTQKIHCICGKDLSQRADSDGRAEELMDVVQYSCEKCLTPIREYAGKSIDDYQLIKCLGSGEMGSVFLVHHPPTARLLVLKLISNLADTPLVKRFQREIYLLRELNHKNLIRYFDSSLEATKPYLVMAYADKGNLGGLVTRGGPVPIEEAVKYIADSLAGLSYIHKQGIVHRDIKPENILLHNQKGELVSKITDFGIAKRYSEAGGTKLTRTSFWSGTPFFIAPEQITDFRNVREPGDIYSMGVTLFYLLTGKLPYDYPSPYEIQAYMMQKGVKFTHYFEALEHLGYSNRNPFLTAVMQEPVSLAIKQPGINTDLALIVDTSLRSNIESRYQTADEFRHDLLLFMKKYQP